MNRFVQRHRGKEHLANSPVLPPSGLCCEYTASTIIYFQKARESHKIQGINVKKAHTIVIYSPGLFAQFVIHVCLIGFMV